MAIQRICSVPGCDKPHLAKSYCRRHYHKNRWFGDPKKGRSLSFKEPERFLRGVVLLCESEECLIWPFGRCGSRSHPYGCIYLDGKSSRVSRLVCVLTRGEPPSPRHQAAHNCGNPLCCNPKHLRWATPSENQLDRLQHGTDGRGSKNYNATLEDHEVRRIRILAQSMKQVDIARMYGVSKYVVNMVVKRRSWAWLD